MKKTILREYARLIVRSGVNVQKGQEVLIYTNAETGKEEDILLLLYSDNGTLTK